jgi:hypothetical protein
MAVGVDECELAAPVESVVNSKIEKHCTEKRVSGTEFLHKPVTERNWQLDD